MSYGTVHTVATLRHSCASLSSALSIFKHPHTDLLGHPERVNLHYCSISTVMRCTQQCENSPDVLTFMLRSAPFDLEESIAVAIQMEEAQRRRRDECPILNNDFLLFKATLCVHAVFFPLRGAVTPINVFSVVACTLHVEGKVRAQTARAPGQYCTR